MQVSCKSITLHQNTDPKIRLLSKYFKTISREKLQLFFFFFSLRLTVTTFTQLVNKILELVFWSMAGKLYFSNSHLEVIHKMLKVKKKKKGKKQNQLQSWQNEISYKAGKMKLVDHLRRKRHSKIESLSLTCSLWQSGRHKPSSFWQMWRVTLEQSPAISALSEVNRLYV